MYISFLSELVLIYTFILLINKVYSVNTYKRTAKLAMFVACVIILSDALLSGLTYINILLQPKLQSVVATYTNHFAIPLLLTSLLYIITARKRMVSTATLLLALGILPLFGLPQKITYISVALTMFAIWGFNKHKNRITASTLFLLGIPMTYWFSDSIDINTALRHVFYAAHIVLLIPLFENSEANA